jgi:hypothetical protein
MTSQRLARGRTIGLAVAIAIGALAISSLVLRAADLPVPERAPPAQSEPVPKPAPLPAPDPAPAPKTEIDPLDRLEAGCIEASDGCRTYRRAADGKFDPLNNIGIACQPRALVCTARK